MLQENLFCPCPDIKLSFPFVYYAAELCGRSELLSGYRVHVGVFLRVLDVSH